MSRLKGFKHSQKTIEKMRLSSLGKKMSLSARKKMSEHRKGKIAWNKNKKFPQFSENNHPNWMGNDVGYYGVHTWVKKWRGQPNKCEVCGNDKLKHRSYNWANIDHKYRRVLEDYIRMCVKCHRTYDRDILQIKVGR